MGCRLKVKEMGAEGLGFRTWRKHNITNQQEHPTSKEMPFHSGKSHPVLQDGIPQVCTKGWQRLAG